MDELLNTLSKQVDGALDTAMASLRITSGIADGPCLYSHQELVDNMLWTRHRLDSIRFQLVLALDIINQLLEDGNG